MEHGIWDNGQMGNQGWEWQRRAADFRSLLVVVVKWCHNAVAGDDRLCTYKF